jgi:DNA-directed RNA polymerase specialized sigma24 family protein
MISAPMEINSLDDAKAFDLLCGTDAQRQQACAYYFDRHMGLVTSCVRKKFPGLPGDLVANAVHDAFLEFYKTAMSDADFDPEKPERLIVKIALRRACDELRQRTHRGKYKEESLDEINGALSGTATAVEWSEAVGNRRAREVQELFRAELAKFPPRQRNIARLMVDRIEDEIGPKELADLYRETYKEPITMPAAKSARDQVRLKFDECLRLRGGAR